MTGAAAPLKHGIAVHHGKPPSVAIGTPVKIW